MDPSDARPVETIEIGTVIDGRYRIDAVLGAGGMGCVYRAVHLGIGRTVALKILRGDLGGGGDAASRFKREALASGRLDHPNIVGVSDSGVLDDSSSFLVMEALEGEPLGDRLRRDGQVPWPEAIEIMRGILRGLHHAHDRGVVHRDIKPGNIFLARGDGGPLVKILDFGIAKLVAGSDEDPASTRTGLTLGTPSYLSPEQAVGGTITPASDLYSATVVLFEMLTGRVPFKDTDVRQLVLAHVGRPPPALAEVAPALVVPPRLEAIVQHGLAKLAAERIASAEAYLAMLDEIASEPAGAEPLPAAAEVASLPHRATSLADAAEAIPRKWIVRAGIVIGVAGAIAIVLAVVTGGDPDGAAAPVPAVIPPVLVQAPARDVAADREIELKAMLHDLASGKTCAERRAVIPKLVALDDPRALPALRAARYRMRGGVLGFGASNTNACLRKDAEAAIQQLDKTEKDPPKDRP